jgi:predicted DNA repair protein MutK
MPGGLVALLDDVSVIARVAAASIDDVGAAVGKAGSKAAGVVIDDAAVTPSYVTGLDPARELPIIYKIARGSLKNKLLFLLPGALLLSWFLPQAITYILILGGSYLAFEGAEKVLEKLGGEKHGKTLEDPIEDPAKFEQERVSGAIRTDLILSAEIMAISLNEIASLTDSFWMRAIALAAVGIAITIIVYGAVALIVKMDDVGLHMAKRDSSAAQSLGRFLLRAMPVVLAALSLIGTIAMLWVGGGIIIHSFHELGIHGPSDWAHGVQHAAEGMAGNLSGIVGWLTYAAISAAVGLILGFVIVFVLHKIFRMGHGVGPQAEAH